MLDKLNNPEGALNKKPSRAQSESSYPKLWQRQLFHWELESNTPDTQKQEIETNLLYIKTDLKQEQVESLKQFIQEFQSPLKKDSKIKLSLKQISQAKNIFRNIAFEAFEGIS